VIELILRIGFSLLIVFGLMWALAKIARRSPAGRGGPGVTVLARAQLTRSASVAVVQVADRALVLGVTEGQVTLLTDADPAALRTPEVAERRDPVALDGAPPPPASRLAGSVLAPGTWRQTMEFLRERTSRR
jgi:flagellar protein FliO/FliZ